MALVIGITGGIGSGKTTVCRVFQLFGVPVFEADVRARQLMDEDPELKKALIDLFGEPVYTSGGSLNREMLAAAIFRNNDLRKQVNALVHPAVRKAFYSWLEQNQSFPYVIYEAAILFEGGFHEKMNYSILITAPENQRIARVMQRSGMTEKMVRERMKSQMPEEEKRQLADLCLENDNTKLILPAIVQIDKKLRTDGTIW